MLLFGTTKAQEFAGCHTITDLNREQSEFVSFQSNTCNKASYLRDNNVQNIDNEFNFVAVEGKENTYKIQSRREGNCQWEWLGNANNNCNNGVQYLRENNRASEWSVERHQNGVTIENLFKKDKSCPRTFLSSPNAKANGNPRMLADRDNGHAVWNLGQCYVAPEPVAVDLPVCNRLHNVNKAGGNFLSHHQNCINNALMRDEDVDKMDTEWEMVPVGGNYPVDTYRIEAKHQNDNCEKVYFSAGKACGHQVTQMQKLNEESEYQMWKVVADGDNFTITNVGRDADNCEKKWLTGFQSKGGQPILTNDPEHANNQWEFKDCIVEAPEVHVPVTLPTCAHVRDLGREDHNLMTATKGEKACNNSVRLRDFNNENHQKNQDYDWEIVPVGGDAPVDQYNLIMKYSENEDCEKKYLSAANANNCVAIMPWLDNHDDGTGKARW
jgi:hypothetical protein